MGTEAGWVGVGCGCGIRARSFPDLGTSSCNGSRPDEGVITLPSYDVLFIVPASSERAIVPFGTYSDSSSCSLLAHNPLLCGPSEV